MKKFALVKWVGGSDAGKFSVIPTSWIKASANNAKLSRNDSIVVEWRDSKKPPPGGFPCFDAVLVNLSDSRPQLEKELEAQTASQEDSSLLESNNEESPEKPYAFPQLKSVMESPDDSITDKTYNPDQQDIIVSSTDGEESPMTLSAPTKQDWEVQKRYLERKVKQLEEENSRLKGMLVKELPELIKSNRELVEGLASTSSTAVTVPTGKSTAVEKELEKKELVPNSGVYVSALAYLGARACSTPGGFVSRMLMALFPMEVLLTSNFKGGAPKQKGAEAGEAKQPLDAKKIAALKQATLTLFPSCKEAQFGVLVNQKLANLRSKKRERERKVAAEKEPSVQEADAD